MLKNNNVYGGPSTQLVYLKINKLYFTNNDMFRQLPSSGYFLLNFSGMEGVPDDEISLSVLLVGSFYYNTMYTGVQFL
jgi:hypothetical protein